MKTQRPEVLGVHPGNVLTLQIVAIFTSKKLLEITKHNTGTLPTVNIHGIYGRSKTCKSNLLVIIYVSYIGKIKPINNLNDVC